MTASSSKVPYASSAFSGQRMWIVAGVVGLAAFAIYVTSVAPGLTWAHQGADGGELLAAANVNGVPHPPGYPLYIPLLQFWLTLTDWIAPTADLAWRGAIFSALSAALATVLTVVTAGTLTREWQEGWLWAGLAGLAYAISPLFWTQAIITEVYALHALLVALLGWTVLVHGRRLWCVLPTIAFGVGHHLTFVLLLPAAFFQLWVQNRSRWLEVVFYMGGGVVLGLLLYARIPLVAGNGPPPINWGYADNARGLWWLVSGAAYRGYLFSSPTSTIFTRLSGWAYMVTAQYTPVGLALALVGLAHWDRHASHLRTFSLLWLVPVSVYAISYNTRDSDIYLLPVAWIMALWLAVGMAVSVAWLGRRFPKRRAQIPRWFGIATVLFLIGMALWRWPNVSLRHDTTASAYVTELVDNLEPQSIVITLGDQQTFSVWYGIWGSGELAASVAGIVPLNESLYQFDWYRRLQGDLFPEIPGIADSVSAVIAQNAGRRPIYFTEQPLGVAQNQLEKVGPLWRLKE